MGIRIDAVAPVNFVYLQHIDWNWLPQRPQFLAKEFEELFPDFNCYYIKSVKRKYLVANDINLKKGPISFVGTPYWNFPIMRILSKYFIKTKIKKLDLTNSIVYVTHPRFYPALKGMKIGMLVYDCMDDSVGIMKRFKKYVSKLEDEISQSADLIVTSSAKLQSNIFNKYQKQSSLVSNGIKLNLFNQFIKDDYKGKTKKLIFFGVIGEWIDQDFLIKVSAVEGVNLQIFGPLATQLRSELQSSYKGVIPQKELYKSASECDVALLPYLINSFTETINPVKMYEYIALRLPIIG